MVNPNPPITAAAGQKRAIEEGACVRLDANVELRVEPACHSHASTMRQGQTLVAAMPLPVQMGHRQNAFAVGPFEGATKRAGAFTTPNAVTISHLFSIFCQKEALLLTNAENDIFINLYGFI